MSVVTEVVIRGRRNPLHFGLAKRLRAARVAADIGIVQLAHAAGLNESAARDTELGGHVPLLNKVERLAGVLNVSPCWLAYGVEAPPLQGDVLACEAIRTRLRQVREAHGLSRSALGKASGTTGQTVANIEAGRTVPSVATVEALAKALGVDLCWLAYGAGQALGLPTV